MVGLVRFVAYLCAMIGNDVSSPSSPTTGLLLVHLFKRPRAHTCDTLNTK